MTSAPPKIQLIGNLHLNNPAGAMAFLMETFPRLTTEVKHTGSVARIVRYESGAGGDDSLQFLGIEVEQIEDIPQGMIAWDLTGNTWRVHDQNEVIWQTKLSWQWLDQTVADRLVGEFTAECPSNWGKALHREFRISTNSYVGIPEKWVDDIELVDYDPSWPNQYAEMEIVLKDLLKPDVALRIEHYGSTSIPNMPAKPVIDILVEIPSFAEARKRAIPIFNKQNWEFWCYSDHMVFIGRREMMGLRTHHIHMAPAGHKIWQGLTFRDYLRTHPEDASRYAELKHRLADEYKSDREGYTEAKGEFVQEILSKALNGTY